MAAVLRGGSRRLQASASWQELLGPAQPLGSDLRQGKPQRGVGLATLLTCLRGCGLLSAEQLVAGLHIAAQRRQRATIADCGSAAAGILLAVTAGEGGRLQMSIDEAVTAIQECGGSAAPASVEKECVRCRWLYKVRPAT
jgi:hypothetical protein